MSKQGRFLTELLLVALLGGSEVLVTNVTLAGNVHEVKYANQADVKIFRVKYENQADLCVYVAEYANQADLKVYFVKYQNQAKWKESSRFRGVFK